MLFELNEYLIGKYEIQEVEKMEIMALACTLFILLVMIVSILFAIFNFISIQFLMKEKLKSSASVNSKKSQEQLNTNLLLQERETIQAR